MSSIRLVPAATLAALALAACGTPKPSAYQATSSPSSYNTHAAEAAPAHGAVDSQRIVGPEERPGLGTSFGETHVSRVRHAPFVRDSESPFARAALYYNDAEGVRAAFAYHQAAIGVARADLGGDISIAVVDEYGRPLPGGVAGGRTYVVGQNGQRYNIEIRNGSGHRVEVVASVDGLDVIDGQPASYAKRGYVLAPYGSVVIDGFRTSEETVAAFRFGTVSDSYAARTSGDRNVGVIGVAFFAERGAGWSDEEIRRRDAADPFPGYAQPPL